MMVSRNMIGKMPEELSGAWAEDPWATQPAYISTALGGDNPGEASALADAALLESLLGFHAAGFGWPELDIDTAAAAMMPFASPWLDMPVVEPGRYAGRIKSFSAEKGFGFIECPQTYVEYHRDVFLHKAQIRDLPVGANVTFSCQVNKDGMPQARGVVLFGERPPPSPPGKGKGKGRSKAGGKGDKGIGKGKGEKLPKESAPFMPMEHLQTNGGNAEAKDKSLVPEVEDSVTKAVLDLVQQAAKTKQLKRGASEAMKALHRHSAELVVLASDAEPVEILSQLPALSAEKSVRFVYVASKAALARACGVSRPVSACSITAGSRLSAQIRDLDRLVAVAAN